MEDWLEGMAYSVLSEWTEESEFALFLSVCAHPHSRERHSTRENSRFMQKIPFVVDAANITLK